MSQYTPELPGDRRGREREPRTQPTDTIEPPTRKIDFQSRSSVMRGRPGAIERRQWQDLPTRSPQQMLVTRFCGGEAEAGLMSYRRVAAAAGADESDHFTRRKAAREYELTPSTLRPRAVLCCAKLVMDLMVLDAG